MAISAHDIMIQGFDRPFKLLDFEMELRPNVHGYAKVLLRMNEKPDLHRQLPYGTTLSIGYSTDSGAMNILFCGVVDRLMMERTNQYYELSIELVTGSIILDRYSKHLAYQDDSMSFSALVNRVLAETKGASSIIATKGDRQTGEMLIQHNETDWAFIRRIASHLNEAVFPDWISGRPAQYFGTDIYTGTADITIHDYATEVDRQFRRPEDGFADQRLFSPLVSANIQRS